MDPRRASAQPAFVGVEFDFHATPEELVDLARSWRDAHGFHLAVEQFFPDWRALAFDGDLPLELHDVDRLSLRRGAFDLAASTGLAFTNGNPGLYISVERVIDNELGRAAMVGSTTDVAEAEVWRRLIRRLRTASHRGASLSNWAAVATAPNHRHTPGAHRLAERGVRMVAFPGSGTKYLFDDLRLDG